MDFVYKKIMKDNRDIGKSLMKTENDYICNRSLDGVVVSVNMLASIFQKPSRTPVYQAYANAGKINLAIRVDKKAEFVLNRQSGQKIKTP